MEIVIVGCGPSLDSVDPSVYEPGPDRVVIAINAASALIPTADYHVAVDQYAIDRTPFGSTILIASRSLAQGRDLTGRSFESVRALGGAGVAFTRARDIALACRRGRRIVYVGVDFVTVPGYRLVYARRIAKHVAKAPDTRIVRKSDELVPTTNRHYIWAAYYAAKALVGLQSQSLSLVDLSGVRPHRGREHLSLVSEWFHTTLRWKM